MENFKWTDEIVEKYAEVYRFSSSRTSIKQFKEDYLPKKDYEILTYKHIVLSNELDKNIIIDKMSKHFEYAHGCPNDFKIHSVLRLSDGEVFTVGDKIQEEDGVYVIDAFWENYGGNDLWFSYNQRKKYGSSLDSAKKVKEPLFTTEDGKAIYANKHFWYVGDAWNVCETWLLENEQWEERLKPKSFSTKEAAEDWILHNKPCLISLNEIELIGKLTDFRIELGREELKELIKSKL